LRAKSYGETAVINLNHKLDEYLKVTEFQKKELYPVFRNLLNGDEAFILDFGCGPGRFTRDLAKMINGKVLGIDITEEFLEIAPKSELVDYKTMKEGKIPLNDNIVDVVWICLVLGGMKGKTLNNTTKEIIRVTKDNGLIFLIENTSLKPDGKHWFFRTYEQYKKLFPSFNINYLHEYYDLGERISIMGGRKIA
jgi:ubiquinone/menaquinone biosynthesis C-methylase UbiE